MSPRVWYWRFNGHMGTLHNLIPEGYGQRMGKYDLARCKNGD